MKQELASRKIDSSHFQKHLPSLKFEESLPKHSLYRTKNLTYYQMAINTDYSQEYLEVLNYFLNELSNKQSSYLTWNLIGSLFYIEGLFDLAKFCLNYAMWLDPNYNNFLSNYLFTSTRNEKTSFLRQKPSFVHILI
ncbi:MAG: hypothetical protein JXA54_12720 [Candidatus Heimdallarchaeota archaeon]|nr:hypothetical protein [Candidatus Heimdallarchaeota archaeon]